MPRPPRSKEVLEKARKEAYQELNQFVQGFASNRKLAIDYLDSTFLVSPSKTVDIQVNLTFTNSNG